MVLILMWFVGLFSGFSSGVGLWLLCIVGFSGFVDGFGDFVGCWCADFWCGLCVLFLLNLVLQGGSWW